MNKTLMKGCGISCGVIALLFLVLVGGGAWFARQMGQEYKVVEETETALLDAFAVEGGWTPAPGLVPAEDRLAVFVTVRQRTDEWRRKLDQGIGEFAAERAKGGGVGGLWRSMRSGSDLGLMYAGFWSARNRILLEEGMGPAEYTWLYGLAYQAWLGHDAAAGVGAFDVSRGQGLRVEVEVGQADPAHEARVRLHELLVPLLTGAEAGGEGGVTAAALVDEQLRLETDPTRVPWQDNLPAVIGAAFAPHRAALEATWSEAVNPLELMFDLEGWAERQDEALGK